ncbi:MAG: 6-phosphogluconolactonase [Verrucomicrobiales bacterium]|nr:6-phosphogluconolactonase [Verrucomicrobiales bacterium]
MSDSLSELHLYVGTYADAGGKGIYPLGREDGKWVAGDAYRSAPNASFGVWSKRHGLFYLVDERAGKIGVYRCDQGKWRLLASTSTEGDQPCHLALNPDEWWLAAANYGSGSIALFPLGSDGGLLSEPTIRQNDGSSKVKERQEGPHAHCVVFSPDGHWLYQTDLGTDEILAFGFDNDRGLTGERILAYKAAPGSGPRHLIFHPQKPLAVLISELASTLTLFEVKPDRLSMLQLISTLPPGATTENLGGHVMINAAGDRLYATNRGHDSIATFAIGDAGQLSFLRDTPSGGASPRFFLLLEEQRLMVVANEEGNIVTFFDVGPDGLLTQSGGIAIPAPAFIFQTHKSTTYD